MAPTSLYAIDTCSLATLQRTYPEWGSPLYWSTLDRLMRVRRLQSVEDVLFELTHQDSEIARWATARRGSFVPLSQDVQQAARAILIEMPALLDLSTGKSSADVFLVAFASVHHATVVTEEVAVGPGSKKIKIPNACSVLGLECISLQGLVDRERDA